LYEKPLINNRIRAREVMLIGEEGQQEGVVKIEEALRKARERNLDLVQVTERIDPPVCRIIDHGKYLYQLEKKRKETEKKTGGDLKGIRLTFNISLHDLETRADNAAKFLNQGNKVKIEMRLRGREKALGEFANEKIEKFLGLLKEKIPFRIERGIKKELRGLTMIISKST